MTDPAPARDLARRLEEAGPWDWLIVTSPRTWQNWRRLAVKVEAQLLAALQRGTRIATVGAATTASLPWFAQRETTTSQGISAEDLLAMLLDTYGGTAILPASAKARPLLADGLRRAGWQVHQAAVYDSRSVPEAPAELARLHDGTLAGVLVRSPSAADALAGFVRDLPVPVFAVGPISAARCRSHGWQVIEIARTDPVWVAAQVADQLP